MKKNEYNKDFKVPDHYFQKQNQHLQNTLLDFKVPKNYFENQQKDLLQLSKSQPEYSMIKPLIQIAAVLAIIFAVSAGLWLTQNSSLPNHADKADVDKVLYETYAWNEEPIVEDWDVLESYFEEALYPNLEENNIMSETVEPSDENLNFQSKETLSKPKLENQGQEEKALDVIYELYLEEPIEEEVEDDNYLL